MNIVSRLALTLAYSLDVSVEELSRAIPLSVVAFVVAAGVVCAALLLGAGS